MVPFPGGSAEDRMSEARLYQLGALSEFNEIVLPNKFSNSTPEYTQQNLWVARCNGILKHDCGKAQRKGGEEKMTSLKSTQSSHKKKYVVTAPGRKAVSVKSTNPTVCHPQRQREGIPMQSAQCAHSHTPAGAEGPRDVDGGGRVRGCIST